MRKPRPITEAERRAAVQSLQTVGGIYDHVALFVEHDRTSPDSGEGDRD